MSKAEKEERLKSLAKALKKEVDASEGLRDHHIKRVSNIAASELREKTPVYFYFTSRPAVAAVMASAALLIILCLPLFLQLNLQEKEGGGPAAELPSLKSFPYHKAEYPEMLNVNAKKTDSSVVLSWESAGSRKDVYKITRSDSPKDFSNAYTVMVAGNQWVDPLKNGSNIVFYKIE